METLNPVRAVLQGNSPSITFNDTGSEDDFYIHVNSNNFYVLTDRGGAAGAWETPHPLQLEADTNTGYLFANQILTTATSFGGDVSGGYNAIVVANDSHTHDTRYFTETESDA